MAHLIALTLGIILGYAICMCTRKKCQVGFNTIKEAVGAGCKDIVVKSDSPSFEFDPKKPVILNNPDAETITDEIKKEQPKKEGGANFIQ